MKSIPLSKLREETAGYNSFVAAFRNPLSPISMSVRFDQIYINLSASPYICLKNEYSQICVSHIKSIKRREREDNEIAYILTCLDYTLSDEPAENTIAIECAKISS